MEILHNSTPNKQGGGVEKFDAKNFLHENNIHSKYPDIEQKLKYHQEKILWVKEITKSQLLDFLAFHRIQSIYIEENKKFINKSSSESGNFQISNTKAGQQKPYNPSNISNSQNLNNNPNITTGKLQNHTIPAYEPRTTYTRTLGSREFELNNIREEIRRQSRQEFIERYESMKEIDRKYPIKPGSAVDLATRGIWYRNHEKYYQYKQEIAQEEVQKRENDAFIQQAIIMNFWNNQDKKRNAR